jgi:AcrR family transcriptional regulator
MPLNKKVAKKKRTRNPIETRAKLLQATIDLVTEKGPEALSLKEAARRAKRRSR